MISECVSELGSKLFFVGDKVTCKHILTGLTLDIRTLSEAYRFSLLLILQQKRGLKKT